MPENNRGESASVDALLTSTLDSVDTAESMVLESAGKSGFGEDELHQIGMAVRESMVNAVVHGNRYNVNKKVHLVVYERSERLVIEITDEGDGFEMNSLPDPLAEENLLKQSGRGILLIQAFVDEFRVRRLERGGTEVTLVKYRTGGSE
jgi:serine/threonine-protein kinase RsbW